MSNKIDKPKQTAPQLITKMKSKGITFKYITEEKAAEYLTDKNNVSAYIVRARKPGDCEKKSVNKILL